MYMMEDVVESVTWKLLEGAEPGGTDSEYLQGWLIKHRDHRKELVLLCDLLLTC